MYLFTLKHNELRFNRCNSRQSIELNIDRLTHLINTLSNDDILDMQIIGSQPPDGL